MKEEFVECSNCKNDTPRENLNCIYCGEVLPFSAGVLSGLRHSFGGWLAVIIALAVLISFLMLIL